MVFGSKPRRSATFTESHKMHELTEFEKECHMPLEEWLDCVEDGAFIDYDGFGELATATHFSDIEISPSQAKIFEFPEWCTHIVWYNR